MQISAIIQARMSSTRLPGKVLKKIAGKSILERVVERSKRITKVDSIIVATSFNSADDKIVHFCQKKKYIVLRGSEKNVLGRYITAIKQYPCDTVVRITADNPLIDAGLISKMIQKHLKEKNDYTRSRGFPTGASAEIFSASALQTANNQKTTAAQQEHLGVYFLEHEANFKLGVLNASKKYSLPIRITVDTNEDLKTVKNIIRYLGENSNLSQIVKLYHEHPEAFVNNKIQQYYPSQQINQAFNYLKNSPNPDA